MGPSSSIEPLRGDERDPGEILKRVDSYWKGGTKQVQIRNSLLEAGGDVVTELDGEEVSSSDDLIRKLRDHKPRLDDYSTSTTISISTVVSNGST
jgi:S1-C subfamily serine protease